MNADDGLDAREAVRLMEQTQHAAQRELRLSVHSPQAICPSSQVTRRFQISASLL